MTDTRTIITEIAASCPVCCGVLRLGYDPDGDPVFCEDCVPGLEAGMQHWASVLNSYAETLALYDRHERRDRMTPTIEGWRDAIQMEYDLILAEHDRLQLKWTRIKEGISIEIVDLVVV